MLNDKIKQYLMVTGCYWAFTLTDGALRMLVVLYFHQLGYSPIEVATLFLLYEFFGIVTNLFGGWLAAHQGLNLTLKSGLALQIIALSMLLLPPDLLTVAYVMIAQAISGIAKDLNKMSAKSSIKLLVPDDAQGQLYRWIALLTGSKNALKGIGFFAGGALLAALGFQGAVGAMAAMLLVVLILSQFALRGDLGKRANKPKFKDLLSKSRAINILSGARFFLFAARDIWFVVALPVFLQSRLDWSYTEVGSLMAAWVIIYGIIQSLAPRITGTGTAKSPGSHMALWWALPLLGVTLLLAASASLFLQKESVLILGLLLFGAFFAINSSLHSYLIVAFAQRDDVSLDVGFYYMSNAAGRLVGTILSGTIYQLSGFQMCLYTSALFILLALLISIFLPKQVGEGLRAS